MKKIIYKAMAGAVLLSMITAFTPQTAQGYALQKTVADINILPDDSEPFEQASVIDTQEVTDDENDEIITEPAIENEKEISEEAATAPAPPQEEEIGASSEEAADTDTPVPDEMPGGLIPWDYSKGMWDWQERDPIINVAIRGVAYGNGVWVAVAEGNRLLTSHEPDASKWGARAASNSATWRSVTYGNGLFVAVASAGSGNRIMTSPDGINWTGRRAPAANSWMCVTYANGMFVAVAQSGGSASNRIMTSTNGISWTARRAPNTNAWRSVTYGNGIWVAVARAGNANRVMTSTDAINWTAHNGGMTYANGVTFGNGMFVASASGYGVFTSTDGKNWKQNMIGNGVYQGVVFGEGLFVTVGQRGLGSERTMVSFDGEEWMSVETPLLTWDYIGYGNHTFVGVANASGSLTAGIITSPHPMYTPFADMYVKIRKENNAGMLLFGAEFELTGITETGEEVSETLKAADGTASLPIAGWQEGTYTITETAAPHGYMKSGERETFILKDGVTEQEDLEFTFINEPLELLIQKVDADTREVLGTTEFNIAREGFTMDITAEDGTYVLNLGILTEGIYTVTEIVPPEGYLDDSVPQEFEFVSGELIIDGVVQSSMTFANHREEEPGFSYERELEYDDTEEPYLWIEEDELDIPKTGAENALGWMLPAAVMMCTGVLMISLGIAERRKGRADEKENDD